MKKNLIFCITIVVIILAALSFVAIRLYGKSGAHEQTVSEKGHRLQLPVPPPIMADESARKAYVATRYWDKFDFMDSTWAQDTTALEETFATYTWMLGALPQPEAAKEIKSFFSRTEVCPVLQDRLYEIAEKYLDDPNSPYRNEGFYISVLEAHIASQGVDSLLKLRSRYQLAVALKNRPGSPAADFSYTRPSGAVQRLSAIGSDYTLLYFYNPDCHDCKRVREYILSAPILTQSVNRNLLTVLAVYTDEDLYLWRRHLSELPKAWTVGYNGSLRNNGTYELRAIPCLYLLDRDKKVVLKDAQIEDVEAYLAAQTEDI